MAQQPESPRLSLPKNQAMIQNHRIQREVDNIRWYFQSLTTITPTLNDIVNYLNIFSDADNRLERLVLKIYPWANARAINAENQIADSQTQLATLQNDYDLLYQAYRVHKLNYYLLKATCIEKNKRISELLQEKFLLRLLNRQFQIQAQQNS
ncbi:3604_t:CDS:2 [Cetraspora pellucida]|uniref:3604_t:CDS:1 n=1 Tax=Cetraspora pellucida TaxID=1433469 RepID=A0A9N8WEH5_9GLOM|nr:3604_t:CDS:2 [Cetraspora pellucida]